MTSTEVKVPVVREDFTDGDRIYRMSQGVFTKGITIYDPDEYIGYVTMLTDEGNIVPLPVSMFVQGVSTDGYCGRIPKIEDFTVGTMLSYNNFMGERVYVKVTKVVPGEFIGMEYVGDYQRYFERRGHSTMDLEDYFLNWEVEG